MEGVEGMLEELGMGELERTEVGRAGTTLEVATTTHGEFRYIICPRYRRKRKDRNYGIM